jgi:hypothetical protein
MSEHRYHAQFLQQVEKVVSADGFARVPLKSCFIRQQDSEWSHSFFALASSASDGILVAVQAGIRSETIESIFHTTSRFAPQKQGSTVTVGTDCWRLGGDYPTLYHVFDAESFHEALLGCCLAVHAQCFAILLGKCWANVSLAALILRTWMPTRTAAKSAKD